MRKRKAMRIPVRGDRAIQPLSETITRTSIYGGIDWLSIPEEELVAKAQDFVDKNRIERKKRLEEADPRLYSALYRKGLLDRLSFEQGKAMRPKGFFDRMGEDEILSRAERLIAGLGIKNRSGLYKADSSLYKALKGRGLLERLIKESRKTRSWASMGDEDIISHAQEFMEAHGITSRSRLAKLDGGLCMVLMRRNLIGRLPLERKDIRRLSSMSDEQLISYAQELIAQNSTESRVGLQRLDGSLYQVLWKRGLLERTGLEASTRRWTSKSDDEVLSYAKRLMEERGIRKRVELNKADGGLDQVLRERGLMDRLGLESANSHHVRWSSLSDDELVRQATLLIGRDGIRTHKGFSDAHPRMRRAMRRRRLLDRLDLERTRKECRSWASMSDNELLAYAQAYIDKGGIQERQGMMKHDSGLYSALQRRGLMDKVGFKSDERAWKRYPDEELIAYAQRHLEEMGISGREALRMEDKGLYNALHSRGLLGRAFALIEAGARREALLQVVDALSEI